MKTQELRKLIREEMRKILEDTTKVAKTGKYEIRYTTDDLGNKTYSVYLDGLQVGNGYDGEGGIFTDNTESSIKNIEKLLGINR